MARAMREAVEAGYEARAAGRIPRRLYAQPSSPAEGLPELGTLADPAEHEPRAVSTGGAQRGRCAGRDAGAPPGTERLRVLLHAGRLL